MKLFLRHIAVLLIVGAIANGVMAQNWQKLKNGMSRYNNVVYGDSLHDKLLIGGNFMFVDDDSLLVVGIAAWDGFDYDSLGHRVNHISGSLADPIWRFNEFKERLHVNGAIPGVWQTNDEPIWVGKFNANTLNWDPLECMLSQNTVSFLSSVIEDTMYFTAYERSDCGLPATNVYQYDGQQLYRWEPFDQIPFYSNQYVGFVIKYGGEFFMTGHIVLDSVDVSVAPIMKYNGNTWDTIPEWHNTNSPIKDFLIHDGKLYLAGYFREIAGAPGNCVAMYDGTSWHNMGGGLLLDYNNPGSGDPIVLDLWVHDDEIYAVGEFNWAGDIPASNIAKWNGTQWCSLGGVFNDDIRSVTTWRDTLYVGGFFETIDGDSVNYLAKWAGGSYVEGCSTPVGVDEMIIMKPLFSISPNPTIDRLLLEIEDPVPHEMSIMVMDLVGKILLTQYWPAGSSSVQLDLSTLSSQIVFVSVNSKKQKMGVHKVFVVD